MPTVIPVRMHFNAQDLWFDPTDSGAQKGDYVITETERGTEFGLVTMDAFDAPESEIKGDLKPILRIATDEDIERAESLAEQQDEAMPLFRKLVKESGLDIKPVGVEFLFGGEKVVFYFAAEDRVDFRDLVRDLAAEFHQRVDMRQIGVRDEARLAGGFAPCGQELCCVRFGGQFQPVSIRMAKEQDLPLNSSKISGVCGRLMCCLRYEFEAYRDFKQRAPKKSTIIDTPLGKAKIVEYNTPRETLLLRLENGKSFTVALKDMTCSEGCRKRAKEQEGPLRPDTVTRETLEAIGTAEIAMQLAELDRTNGTGSPYALDMSLLESDRTSTRRRHETKEPSAEEQDAGRTPRRKNPGKAQTQKPITAPSKGTANAKQVDADTKAEPKKGPRGGGMKPHRASKATESLKPQTQAKNQDSASASPEPKPRRQTQRRQPTNQENLDVAQVQNQRRTRRHHTSSPQPEMDNFQQTAKQEKSTRQHKVTGNEQGKKGQIRSGEQTLPTASNQTPKSEQAPKTTHRRRHPGDRGGSKPADSDQ